jgi:high-affinity iron transporter
MRRIIVALMLLCLGTFPAWAETIDATALVATMTAQGDAAIAAYTPERGSTTADVFADLYFDSFEGSGLEAAIAMVDPSFKLVLEAQFGQLMGKARKGETLTTAWATLRADLERVPGVITPKAGFWGTFLQSFLILVREGFEALLVISALTTSLRRSGAADKVKIVYHGVGWALGASLLTAWALSSLIHMGGEGREVMEGGTMLLASAVLFYCSYWLFAKREAARWQSYVKQQIDQALSKGRLFALGFAAFLAVYREGAETALFYQALAAAAPGQIMALAAGLATAIVALAGITFAMRVLSVRLPLGVFFAATAGLLYFLALSFAGKGVLELQNGKALSITPLNGWPSLDWIGLFPTVEGVAAQALLVAPLVLALALWGLKRQSARAT